MEEYSRESWKSIDEKHGIVYTISMEKDRREEWMSIDEKDYKHGEIDTNMVE